MGVNYSSEVTCVFYEHFEILVFKDAVDAKFIAIFSPLARILIDLLGNISKKYG